MPTEGRPRARAATSLAEPGRQPGGPTGRRHLTVVVENAPCPMAEQPRADDPPDWPAVPWSTGVAWRSRRAPVPPRRNNVGGWVSVWLNPDLQEGARQALATLTRREQEILRLRFGIGGLGDHTVGEVGQRLALPGVRIRQIEVNALRKLRHPSHRRRGDDFSDG
jgi:hypothetical protein